MKLPFDPGAAPIVFTNTSGEDCPPHGMLACFGFEYDAGGRVLKFKCRKPTGEDVGSDETVFAINGPTKAPAGKEGACFLARHAAVWAKVDESYDFGDFEEDDPFALRIGPVADQWHLSRDGTGFIFVGARDDAGQIHKHRVMVLKDFAGTRPIFVRITQATACALDFGDIDVGSQDDGDGPYLEGRFCDEYGGGELLGDADGYRDGDPIQVFPTLVLRGYMHRNCIVQVVKTKIRNNTLTVYRAVAGGVQSATGTVITADGDDYTVEIGPAGTGGEVVIVPATSVHGDEFEVDQVVSVEWQRVGFQGSRLRIHDWTCPVVDTGFGV